LKIEVARGDEDEAVSPDRSVTNGINAGIFKEASVMTRFVRSYKVRFEDCDMAGIVFFPNYFVIFNRLLEDWFSDALHVSFGELHSERNSGMPLLNIQVSFKKASRIGDVLEWKLDVRRLGAKSLTLGASASSSGEERIALETTLVAVDLVADGVASREIHSDIRAKMEKFLVAT
jgi:4-hydroxybenzoyl-CoA thioesterase